MSKVKVRYTQPTEQKTEGDFLKTSGILILKVNYKLRTKIKEEIEFYIAEKTVPNKQTLIEQKKINKDFGFHLAVHTIKYPNADITMSDLLILELVPNITGENYSAFYFSVRTLEGVYGIVGTKVPVDKGAFTSKTKYHTLPTYIAKGEIVKKNYCINIPKDTYIYIPKYRGIFKYNSFRNGYHYFDRYIDKVEAINEAEFIVIGLPNSEMYANNKKIYFRTVNFKSLEVIFSYGNSNTFCCIALNTFLEATTQWRNETYGE